MSPSRFKRLRVELLEARHLLTALTVDTHWDIEDPNDGVTSLREAIAESNNALGPDEIFFAPSLTGQALRLTEGQLIITDELAIVGPGADRLTLDASGNDPTPGTNNGDGSRLFYIGNGLPDVAPQVSISGLTLTGGDVADNGGAIWTEGFGYEGFATGTISFADEILAGSGAVDFSVSQRESTGTLALANGSIEITTTRHGAAAGAVGATGSGVDIIITDINDDSDILHSATYDAGTNTIRITADLNANGNGVSAVTIVDLADAIGNIETVSVVNDFIIGHVTSAGNALEISDAGTSANVLTGGLAQSSGEGISITSTSGAASNIFIAFVEQAGIGSTPIVSGDALSGYTVAIDSGNTETTIADIAIVLGHIAEIDTATTTSTRSFNGSLDNTPAALTFLTGARDAGTDIITVTATQAGPAFNRVLSFNTFNTIAGGIVISDDGTNIVVAIDNHSKYNLSAIAQAINTGLANFNAEVSGNGSGTYEADKPNDNITPETTNVIGGLDSTGSQFVNAAPKPLILDRVFISDNHAQGYGGGVYSEGAIRLTNSTIAGNLATYGIHQQAGGGGIYGYERVEITSSTLSDNDVAGDGVSGGGVSGGGVSSYGEIRIAQSTITNNRALGNGARGGGVGIQGGSLTLSGSIVAGNSASGGMPDLTTGDILIEYSLIGDAAGLTLSGTNILIGGDPRLDVLADNGGPTPTHQLLADSPAINAGDPSLIAGKNQTPKFDQRGETGFERIGAGRIDLGAVETPAGTGNFDDKPYVNGSDFLSWQRGFGEIYSTDDLNVWQQDYGKYRYIEPAAIVSELPPSPLATTASSNADLLDAALALEWLQTPDDNNHPFVAPQAIPEITLATGVTSLERPSTIQKEKQSEPTTQAANDPKSTDEPWLDEELLQRVFG